MLPLSSYKKHVWSRILHIPFSLSEDTAWEANSQGKEEKESKSLHVIFLTKGMCKTPAQHDRTDVVVESMDITRFYMPEILF